MDLSLRRQVLAEEVIPHIILVLHVLLFIQIYLVYRSPSTDEDGKKKEEENENKEVDADG